MFTKVCSVLLMYQACTFVAFALPPNVDHSTSKHFPPIRTQDDNSCNGWATTYYQLTYEVARCLDWDAKQGGDQYLFSPRWTYNMLNSGTDNGSILSHAYDLLCKHGAATWAEFFDIPSETRYTTWCTTAAVWEKALAYRPDTIGTVRPLSTLQGIENLKQKLAQGYVLVMRTYIGSWQYTTVSDHPDLDIDNDFVGQKACAYVANTNHIAHTIAIVGYHDSIWIDANQNAVPDTGELGALKLANSFGPDHGNQGFLWLAYDGLRQVPSVSNAPTDRQQAAWDDQAYWLGFSGAKTPGLICRFTLNTACRNQVRVKLIRAPLDANPADPLKWNTTWQGRLFSTNYNNGGPLGFDGMDYTNAMQAAPDGHFVFDATYLLPQQRDSVFRYAMRVVDTDSGAPVQVKALALLDPSNPQTLVQNMSLPRSTDQASIHVSVEYPLTGNRASTPIIHPISGAYDTAVTVTLTVPDTEAILFYTTTGAEPNLSSALYSGPFVLAHSATVKARAFKGDLYPSTIAIAEFELPQSTTIAPHAGFGNGLDKMMTCASIGQGRVKLYIQANVSGWYDLRIFDITGRTAWTRRVNLCRGSRSSITWQPCRTNPMARTPYLAECKGPTSQQSQRLLLVR